MLFLSVQECGMYPQLCISDKSHLTKALWPKNHNELKHKIANFEDFTNGWVTIIWPFKFQGIFLTEFQIVRLPQQGMFLVDDFRHLVVYVIYVLVTGTLPIHVGKIRGCLLLAFLSSKRYVQYWLPSHQCSRNLCRVLQMLDMFRGETARSLPVSAHHFKSQDNGGWLWRRIRQGSLTALEGVPEKDV